MGKSFVLALALLALCSVPLRAQTYHPQPELGAWLGKTPALAQSGNAGGRNILENSCIYNETFAISESKEVLDHCDQPAAIATFVKEKGQPDQILKDPGGKTELVYNLLFKDNAFRVKVFFSCFADKTELFAMVDCVNERNRIMPGGHGPGGHGPGGRPGRYGP